MRRYSVQPVGGCGGGGCVHGRRGDEPNAGCLRQGAADGGAGFGGARTERSVELGQEEDVEQQRQRSGRGGGGRAGRPGGGRRRGQRRGRRRGPARVGGQTHKDGTVFAAGQRRRNGRGRDEQRQPVTGDGQPTADQRRRSSAVSARRDETTVAVRVRGRGRNGHQHVADVR